MKVMSTLKPTVVGLSRSSAILSSVEERERGNGLLRPQYERIDSVRRNAKVHILS
jgi:hypothetical protein